VDAAEDARRARHRVELHGATAEPPALAVDLRQRPTRIGVRRERVDQNAGGHGRSVHRADIVI